jgi:hypothetical protein
MEQQTDFKSDIFNDEASTAGHLTDTRGWEDSFTYFNEKINALGEMRPLNTGGLE